MAYNKEKLTKLEALQELSKRIEQDYATKESVSSLSKRVDDLVTAGGEPNVIETVKVNGVAQEVSEKAVDIKVPTKVSELTNDSAFQTNTEVAQAIQTAISKTGHAVFKKVDAVPETAAAEDNVLYLVMNSKTKHYDIYAKVENEVVLLDDTTVDLTNYVEKEDGKGLSTNDYTTEDKEKLAGLNNYTHPSYTQQSSGFYKVTVDATGHVSAVEAVTKEDITGLGIPAQDTTYSPATSEADGLMSKNDKTKLDGIEVASLEEVQEMLNEVFATEQA
nr:MAG: hypothetical protein [Bacteriophage sp.]